MYAPLKTYIETERKKKEKEKNPFETPYTLTDTDNLCIIREKKTQPNPSQPTPVRNKEISSHENSPREEKRAKQ
jgi:hypothetical protein